jgi:hypothetical protein
MAEEEINEEYGEEEKEEEPETESEEVNVYDDENYEPEEAVKPIQDSAIRQNKYTHVGTQIIYEDNNIVNLINFKKAYRYLFNLKNTLDTNNPIYKEITEKTDGLREMFNNCLKLITLNNKPHNYNKYKVETLIDDFVINNNNQIMDLIDYVFSLGRVVPMYDPNRDGGYR